VQNGLAVARACEQLKREGFVPDIVIGHSGWGETLFVNVPPMSSRISPVLSGAVAVVGRRLSPKTSNAEESG
jgi:hypothetical protein